MRNGLGLAVRDDDVGLTGNDRFHEVADAVLRVLVVAVGVHHDVRAMRERVVHAVAERAGQAHVPGVVHEVRDAVLPGDGQGAVRGPVVDDQDRDLVHAVDLGRDRLEHRGQGLFLVEAGTLDEDLHVRPLRDAGARGT